MYYHAAACNHAAALYYVARASIYWGQGSRSTPRSGIPPIARNRWSLERCWMPLWKVCLKKSPGAAHAEARVGPLPVPRVKRVKHDWMIVKRGGIPHALSCALTAYAAGFDPLCISYGALVVAPIPLIIISPAFSFPSLFFLFFDGLCPSEGGRV